MQSCFSYQQNRYTAIELGSRNSLQDLEFHTKQQWQSQFNQLILITFKMSQSGSKKIQRIQPYGKPLRFISLPNVMHEYLKLDLYFFFFMSHCNLDETFSVNISILALGQKTSVFCAELELPVPLSCIPFLYNSGSLLFCFTDVSSCD